MQVQELVREDFQMSTRFTADCVEVDKSSAQNFNSNRIEDLQLRGVSGIWVPHTLSEENRAATVNSAKHIRRVFFREGMERFCNKLVMQHESWVSFGVTHQATEPLLDCTW